MRTIPSVLMMILTLWTVQAALSQAPPDSPEAVVQALMSDDAAVRKAAEADAVRLGAPMVKPLCDLMAEGTPRGISVAEKTLFAIVADATKPGNETQRDRAVQALMGQMRGPSSPRAQVLAMTLLALAGQPGAVALLATPVSGDARRTALERVGGREVAKGIAAGFALALAGGLTHEGADTVPAWLRTLGQLRRPEALPLLTIEARSGIQECAVAALAALGMIADPEAAVTLAEATEDPHETVREAAVGALIALADAEQQRGGPFARRCYRKAYDYAVTPAQRTAALMGLADTDPSMRVQWLLTGMGETHTRPVARAELLKTDAAQLAGPLQQRIKEAQGEELEALRGLAEAKEIGLGA